MMRNSLLSSSIVASAPIASTHWPSRSYSRYCSPSRSGNAATNSAARSAGAVSTGKENGSDAANAWLASTSTSVTLSKFSLTYERTGDSGRQRPQLAAQALANPHFGGCDLNRGRARDWLSYNVSAPFTPPPHNGSGPVPGRSQGRGGPRCDERAA